VLVGSSCERPPPQKVRLVISTNDRSVAEVGDYQLILGDGASAMALIGIQTLLWLLTVLGVQLRRPIQREARS